MTSREDAPDQPPGIRVYLIRKALGPNVRSELSLRAFADVVNAKAEELGLAPRYDASTLSKIERGARQLALEEVPLFAAVDPEQRGPAWLAWNVCPKQAAADAVRQIAEQVGGVRFGLEDQSARVLGEETKTAAKKAAGKRGRGK